jgi:hypothetical protein
MLSGAVEVVLRGGEVGLRRATLDIGPGGVAFWILSGAVEGVLRDGEVCVSRARLTGDIGFVGLAYPVPASVPGGGPITEVRWRAARGFRAEREGG